MCFVCDGSTDSATRLNRFQSLTTPCLLSFFSLKRYAIYLHSCRTLSSSICVFCPSLMMLTSDSGTGSFLNSPANVTFQFPKWMELAKNLDSSVQRLPFTGQLLSPFRIRKVSVKKWIDSECDHHLGCSLNSGITNPRACY